MTSGHSPKKPAATPGFFVLLSNPSIAKGARISAATIFTLFLLAAATAQAATPPVVPPNTTYTKEVSSTSASLGAEVNPEGSATTYRFETSTGAGPFAPVPGGEGSLGEGTAAVPVSAQITGLAVLTAYHYRVVAENTAHERAEGPELTFTTQPAGGSFALPDNRAWELVSPPDKHGSAIFSLQAEDGVIQAAESGGGIAYIAAGPIPTEGHEPAGNHAYEPSQIISKRSLDGWDTQDVYTPRNPAIGGGAFSGEPEYVMFNSDLSLGLVEPRAKDPLPPLPETAEESVYLRDDEDGAYQPLVSAENVFEGAKSKFGVQEGHGVIALAGAPDLSHVVLESLQVPLVDGAGEDALYEWTAGRPASEPLVLVSVLPDGQTPGRGHTFLGQAAFYGAGDHILRRAISEDGERVVWGAGGGNSETVYLRENALQPQSPLADGAAAGRGNLTSGSDEVAGVTATSGTFQMGQTITGVFGVGPIPAGTTITKVEEESPGVFKLTLSAAAIRSVANAPLEAFSRCTVPTDACTIQVSPGEASYQTASGDGSRVFYTDAGELYVFTDPVGAGPAPSTVDLTEGVGVQGAVIGASENGETVYLVTAGALSETENAGKTVAAADNRNARGQKPEGGTNLYGIQYEHDRWQPTFIANLSEADAPDWAGEREGAEGHKLTGLTARVSPDGSHLAFMSEEKVTGYENSDVASGAADEEVYEYDAASNRTVCASCNPTGERPTGVFDPVGAALVSALLADEPEAWEGHWLAASIPGWTAQTLETALYQSRYLDDDGRLFFDSPDSLVPADVNGNENVFEYDPEGLGGCSSETENPADLYSPQAQGCVGLISSGDSSEESAFLDASGLNPATGEEGEDVFFITSSKLAAQDTDTAYDVYDAHICSTQVPCPRSATSVPPVCSDTDSCRAAPTPQPEVFGVPSSQTLSGQGNLTPPPAAIVPTTVTKKTVTCKTGFVKKERKKKHVCVKKAKSKRTKSKKASHGKGRA